MEQKNNSGVFAELHEMFGECVPRNVINEIGNRMSWDVTRTVDHLIKYIETENEGQTSKAARDENLKIQYKVSECQENDRDVDVLIESENLSGPGVSDSQARSTGAIRKQPREVERVPNFSDFLKTGDNVFKDTTKAAEAKRPSHPLMEEVCKDINSGIKVMILMRGLPGSGKTHLARNIIDQTVKGDYRRYIFSSDNFFYDVNGVYRYDLEKLSEAHAFNQNCVFKRAYDGWSPIIVDNTSMKLWEMHVYCKYAIQFGYVVRVLEPTTPWAWNVFRLSQKNKHSVPRDAIERMLLKYEKLPGEQELLNIFQMNYTVPIPQLRHHPPVELPSPVDPPPAEIHNDLREKSEVSGSTSDESPLVSPEVMAVDWPSHEDEVNTFWNISSKAVPQAASPKPTEEVKEQRTPRKNSIPENSLLHLLKESIMPKKDNMSAQKAIKFEKHRKGCRNENESFVQVRQIYPTIPIQYLWDLFVNCKGDIEWTVDIMLQEESHPQLNDTADANDLSCTCDGLNYKESPWQSVTESPVEVKKMNIPTPQRQRNQRRNAETDEAAVMKRRIEEAISINEEHYSDHVKKIRDIRRGIFPTFSSPEITESPECADMGACSMREREDSPSSETSDPEDDMVMEVDLGDTLINHMESLFFFDGGVSEKPKDLKTTVFMPMSLLRQLHALWVESLFNQLEEQRVKDVMEDENYARLLMLQDCGQSPDSFLQDCVDIGDMADMEFTWEAYKREQWRDKTPQTLASQLTRTKLHETFPEADKGFLDEILAANNYKFTTTVELLMQSLGTDRKSVKDNGLQIIEEMKRENVKMEEKEKLGEATDEKGSVRKRNEVLMEFEENRNKANHHTQLKSECYQKAQDAIRKNLAGVAGYYNQVANLHKKKIDEYNHIAANCIVEAHNLKQNNSEMLDLHYLHVSEAIVCLDVFLDRHINYLRTRKKPYKFVFVITGRGLHSARGVPTIKNNAKQRLTQRSLKCSEVNPGLLKVKIFYTSKMSEET